VFGWLSWFYKIVSWVFYSSMKMKRICWLQVRYISQRVNIFSFSFIWFERLFHIVISQNEQENDHTKKNCTLLLTNYSKLHKHLKQCDMMNRKLIVNVRFKRFEWRLLFSVVLCCVVLCCVVLCVRGDNVAKSKFVGLLIQLHPQ
jgi:hypothetical protein